MEGLAGNVVVKSCVASPVSIVVDTYPAVLPIIYQVTAICVHMEDVVLVAADAHAVVGVGAVEEAASGCKLIGCSRRFDQCPDQLVVRGSDSTIVF